MKGGKCKVTCLIAPKKVGARCQGPGTLNLVISSEIAASLIRIVAPKDAFPKEIILQTIRLHIYSLLSRPQTIHFHRG